MEISDMVSVMIRSLCAIVFLTLTLSTLSFAKKDEFQRPGPVHLDKNGERWARESLKKMSLEEKIGQMFVIWSRAQFMNVNSQEYLNLRDTMHKYHIGAFGLTVRYEDGFLYKNEPLEAAMVINQLQQDSAFPLIFAADFERGLGMRLNGTTSFPHAMAFGATNNVEYARESGRITAQEARAIGVQWNWFPDADVNSNPANPIINTRSFGEDPKEVGAMAAAYIEGAHEFGMLVTAKHFPGHGDTDTDSHLAVPHVNADQGHLESVELPPFRAAIKAGVDAILVAHIVVPVLDPDPNHVATISPAIVTDLLQKQMGFKGLVITDALDMNGLTKLYQPGPMGAGRAAVDAVKAGNDMLLIPSDLNGSYHGLLEAVRSGEIPESRIDESVLKILHAKASAGLNKAKLVDIGTVTRVVAKPQSLATAQRISDAAVTLVRDNHRILPLNPMPTGTNAGSSAYQPPEEFQNRTLVLIFTDDARSDSGRTLDQQIRLRIPDASVIYVDPRSAAGMTQPVMDAARQAKTVIAAVFIVPVAGRVVSNAAGGSANQVALPNVSAVLLQTVVQAAADKTVVVAMGNPYIGDQLPEVQTYLCTFSNATVSEISAVKAMFGEIPMPGRLPVTIPNIAERGMGLGSPAKPSSGGSQ
jgi:beta-N-acetylhexosaminidase